ncbi:phospho-N-acetylmuramoyl-pentapeptide-transferase [Candidatus Peregrinibacteria bacterium CG10_big_fil_rev_8_21_14_0_10_36_19]|nr:MAG: phospho-N-acetylmuramoyl-pentapeptide-transferase [Candidatus Peregrinibacteria bacterium CG10_big_fil_rev_8_21_14_0_10_36_19]
MNILHQTISNLTLITGSSTIAFIIALSITPWFTKQLIKFKIGKQIRENTMSGEKSTLFSALHAKKSGTPTMGGLLIWGTVILVAAISRILSATGVFDRSLLNRKETWIPLFTLITCGILGAVDDYLNVKGIGNTKGLSAKLKLLWLTIFSGIGAYWFHFKLGFNSINLPIPGADNFEVGIWYIPIFIFVIIGTANAVNFTDGLDGLASGLLIMSFGAFGVIAYIKGLLILAALCGVICGALFAFLWFNVPPARFYMGDTGSLALGATLGVIAMLTQQTLILPIIGFIFVIETLSVIIQLFSKKFFKRKVFKIAPIHHHFEQCGYSEFTVVMRFWIVGAIMAIAGTILGLINLT